jgi:peptidoglycan/LPS O-acetylase OafA/YrhL
MVLFVPAVPFVHRMLARAGLDAPNLGFALVYTMALVAVGYFLRRFYSEPVNRWVRRRWDRREPMKAQQREIVHAGVD